MSHNNHSDLPPLLQTLLVPPELMGKCRSIQDCLRYNFQHIPAKQVQQVLQEDESNGLLSSLGNASLRITKGKLLSGPMNRIRTTLQHNRSNRNVEENEENRSTTSSTTTTTETVTTLDLLQDWTLVLYFMQLLLELQTAASGQDTHHHSSAPPLRGVTDMTEKDLYENILNLTRASTGMVCTQLEHVNQSLLLPPSCNDHSTVSSSDTDDYSSVRDLNWYSRVMKQPALSDARINVRAVACYVWQALLRMSKTYIPRKPKYLSQFWKSLCDIASAFVARPNTDDANNNMVAIALPYQMSLNAIQSLLDFLREGTIPTLQEHRPQVKVLRFKQIGFFLSRLHFFLQKLTMPCSNDSDDGENYGQQQQLEYLKRFVEPLLGQFALWKGLGYCLPAQTAEVPEMTTAAHKAHKCFVALYRKGVLEETDLIPRTSELATTDESDPDELQCKEMAVRAVALGKARFLLSALQAKLLDNPWENSNDLESLLKLFHAIVFQAIPFCLQLQQEDRIGSNNTNRKRALPGDQFLMECFPILFHTLDTILKQCSPPQQERIHRLVTCWLGLASNENGHPLAREVYVLLVVQCILAGKSHAAEWCHLLVELLMDARTVSSLRQCVAHVLRRLLLEWNKSGSSKISVHRQVEDWIVNRAQQLAREWQPGSDKSHKVKKRKRSESCRRTPALAFKELQTVGRVLLLVSKSAFSDFQHLQKHQQQISKSSSSKELLLAALGIYCHQYDFSSNTTLLLNCIGLQTTESPLKSSAVDALSVALLAFHMVQTQNNETKPLENFQFQHLLDLLRSATKIEKRKFTQLHAIYMFGYLSKIVAADPSQEALHRMTKTYKKVFSSSDWSCNALALSSLLRFSKNAKETYKPKLEHCLPSPAKAMMISRVNRSTGGKTSSARNDVETMEATERQFAHALGFLTVPLPDNIFPNPTSIIIENGSYIMSMATQEGREAIVVFPPGEKSLKDIAHMLDGTDGSRSTLLTLRSATANQHGCHLRLQAS